MSRAPLSLPNLVLCEAQGSSWCGWRKNLHHIANNASAAVIPASRVGHWVVSGCWVFAERC